MARYKFAYLTLQSRWAQSQMSRHQPLTPYGNLKIYYWLTQQVSLPAHVIRTQLVSADLLKTNFIFRFLNLNIYFKIGCLGQQSPIMTSPLHRDPWSPRSLDLFLDYWARCQSKHVLSFIVKKLRKVTLMRHLSAGWSTINWSKLNCLYLFSINK